MVFFYHFSILVSLDFSARNLLKCFVTKEIMRWPGIETFYGEALHGTDVFSDATPDRWEDLHTRVIEHVS